MINQERLELVRTENENHIGVDFDGVLHSYTTPFAGTDYIPDPPVEGSLDAVKRLCEQGYVIIIFSARAAEESAIDAIWEWLEKYGFSDYISEVTNIKPCCKVIVDDKCITFKGNWGETLYDIDTFEPWYENPALK